MVREIARQVHVPAPEDHVPNLSGRTAERHRAEVRVPFGSREATVADAEALEDWLRDQAAVVGAVPDHPRARLEARRREPAIEPPAADRVERIARAAIPAHEERLFARVRARPAPEARARLEVSPQPESDAPSGADGDGHPGAAPALLLQSRGDPGRPSLAGVQAELAQLEPVRRIGPPADLFDQVLPRELGRCRRRVAVEAPHEPRRRPEAARLTWLAAFVHLRGRPLTDDPVDLPTETIHRIGARAERRVDRAPLDDLKRVSGKQDLLFELAGAALDQPEGIVREVVFPVVSEQTSRDLVQEAKATGPIDRTTLRPVIRNSHEGHYQRMAPRALRAPDFRSNNRRHRPVVRALDLLKRDADTKPHTFPAEEDVPIDGVVRGPWRDAVVEKDAEARARVDRTTCEICAPEALRDKPRCEEVRAVGANRHRDPGDDVPTDFESQRTPYSQALNLPLAADRFIADLQAEMRQAPHALDAGLPTNALVRIGRKRAGRTTVTPLDARPDPPNPTALKAEVTATWPMTSLLDMVKGADPRLHFTEALKSPTAYETPDRAVLRPRPSLRPHGIGTNAGSRRMAGLESGVTSKGLAHVRRRHLGGDAPRRAIAIVTNGTSRARNPAIWGDGTTARASDSKHFGAWDQNLTTRWHVRHGGRGIMIYWHVERKSLCIHSQLESPSSSEVASMIEGVVHHRTEMEVDRQYVDPHGRSTVAFAFRRLLGFQLLPRLKAIHKRKLYRPDVGQPDAHRDLRAVLTKPINWELIRQRYDPMVKYATAVRLGTAETEAIPRRFTRHDVRHPTSKAFAGLGKAVKTIFLCRHLHGEGPRREVQEGLNVIEQWNGAHDFVSFARRGELTSNRREDHEVGTLASHLLQDRTIYVDTLMLQRVLAQPHWGRKLGPRDLGALTPLIWEHVNPYGRFELDMNVRIPLD